jgi:hypothetical protein
MHWLKLLKNNLNQQLFKSKHLQVSYLEPTWRHSLVRVSPAMNGV